jgi:hypothetical protein
MIMVNRRWLALVALLFAGAAVAAAAGDAQDSFHYRIETPSPQLLPEGRGLVRVEIEGFDTRARRPGVPDVPWRTLLVAIPEGAEPRLEIAEPQGEVLRLPAVPLPVARVLADRPALDDGASYRRLYDADPDAYEAARSYPESRAWLGKTGVLRDQRYVALHLAPVRYDGRSGELLVEPSVDVTVRFDGDPAGSGSPREDPRFEAIYRRAFVNYGQGRAFRLSSAGEAAPLSSAGESTAGLGGPLRRIVVRQNGVVRLDHALLLSESSEFLAHDPATWKLTSRGTQVPLHIHQPGGNPAILEPGEWVQFYGQALDDEPKQVLNTDTGGIEDIFEVRDYSDENVYFLSVETGSQPSMPVRDASPGPGPTASHFPYTRHLEIDDVFFPLAGADLEYWLPLLSEASPIRTESVSLPGLASGTEPAQIRVALRGVSECDGLSPDHASRVSLENASMQTLLLGAGDPNNDGNENLGVFDGQTMFVHDFDWAHSNGDPELSDPVKVEIQVDDLTSSCPTGGTVRNDVLLDWVEIDYRRSFLATGDLLTFDYPDGEAEFEIDGMQSPAGDVDVYEITGENGTSGVVDAVRLTGAVVGPNGQTYTVRFGVENDPGLPDGTLRRFVVAGADSVSLPAAADFQTDRVSMLRQDTTPADLIVIAHPDLLDSRCSDGANPCSYDADCVTGESDRCELDPSSMLSQLLAFRATQGISSRLARIQDVEDEFGHGLTGPVAIESFLEWVFAGGWGVTPPLYVMLLGDASYDLKGGTAGGTYVPTQLMIKNSPILAFYVSDNVMADVAGDDQMPDLTIGRVSARSLEQAETAVGKILDYEQSPVAGDWKGNAVLVSDRANDYADFEAAEFERINKIGEDVLAGSAYTSQNLRYWTDRCVPSVWTCTVGGAVCADDDDCSGGGGVCRPNCDTAGMRMAIQDAVNGVSGPGAAVVQYMGHGNFDLWSSDVLFCAREAACSQDDTLSLTNGGKLPWLIVHNCLSGGFHSLNEKSFGEQWQKYGSGGAAAVFAPSGLGFRFLGEGVTEVIWEDLYGAPKERSLSVPVMNSLVRLCTQDSIEGCQYYTLLGDPSMTLALPDVQPPTDLVAAGDNGIVNLSWAASGTAGATYDVYRTKQLLPPYTLPYVKINGAPLSTPSYGDSDVINTQDYYYYVVAVDADGYESRWSNFNSDCDVVGPDCVVATPINATPPAAPANLSVTDVESGGRLDVAWSRGMEVDIDQWTVHFGTTPALGQTVTSYLNRVDLTGLQDGVTYHIAVSATNTSGFTSLLSETVTGVPSLIVGARSPGFVGDLLLSRSGSDGLLSWGEVSYDIYGKPCEVDHYEIYRGTTPQFVPSAGNRIGVTVAPSFTDVGELTEGGSDQYYLVRAIDGNGNPGGLGGQLPDGTLGLIVTPSETVPGNVVLNWPTVTTDFDGAPITVESYEVYDFDQPFGRGEIESGAVGPPVATVSSTSVELSPGSQSRYYSVLAVDPRGNRSPF